MATTTDEASPAARGRTIVLLVVGLLFGLLGARFVLAGGDAGPTAPPVGLTVEERIVALRADLDRDPDDLRAWQEIATLSIQQAELTQDPSWYPQAREAITRSRELAPDAVELQILEGNLALALHDFAEADRIAGEVLDTSPDSIGGLTIQVDAHVELGRYDAAADALQQLLDVRPGLPALARTSYLRELRGDLDGAVTAMQQAVDAGSGLVGELANVTALLGDLQLRRGDYAAATRAYEDALGLVSDFPPAVIGQARLQAAEGDVTGALERLDDLVAQEPHPGALTLKLELEQATGRDGAADTLEVLRAVTALQASSGQVVDLELAEVEVEAGDTTRGFQLAQDTYRDRPTAFAASVLAAAVADTDGPGSAERYARQSLELGSLDPVLNVRAATVLAGRDDRLAATAVERALQHDPSGTFRHRTDLVELAEQLGVAVPDSWRTEVDS